MKSLTADERAHIADVLRRLREHFPSTWPGGAEGHEHRLIEFAYYERCRHHPGWECCRDLLAEAAQFAVGQELVVNHGFRRVMLDPGRARRYGVAHPALGSPLDLAVLEDGCWCQEEYDQPRSSLVLAPESPPDSHAEDRHLPPSPPRSSGWALAWEPFATGC